MIVLQLHFDCLTSREGANVKETRVKTELWNKDTKVDTEGASSSSSQRPKTFFD